jgi:trans-aconitate 2-methyltransferase
LARLDTSGVRRVLDAGCGTGRDTQLLLDLIPDVHVVAVDASHTMLDQLARRLADRRERVQIIHADLTQPLPIAQPVDAIISVAAFHWISDHSTLFRNLASVLDAGGQFVADCGGQGNAQASSPQSCARRSPRSGTSPGRGPSDI